MITQQPLTLGKTILAIGLTYGYLNFELYENLQTLTLHMFL